jgi:molybdate transport system ATP-binding protein
MSSGGLQAKIVRKIHEGLSLDVDIELGRARGVLFGPSGSGKTSLLRLVAGLDRPDFGRIRIGESLWFDSSTKTNMSLRLRRVGMIFQDDLLFPHLSVEANLRFGLKSWSKRDADRRVQEIAMLCEVGHLRDRRPETLSGGERQRVGLARAIAPRPKLLLCDEPVSAIDLDGRFALLNRLRQVQEVEAIPMLYVTHNPAEAVSLGEVLFRLEGGKIVDQGLPLDVLARRKTYGNDRLDDMRNVFRGVISGHSADHCETIVTLTGGPNLVVPFVDRSEGSPVTLIIRADDILLANCQITGLSARNVLAGRIERFVRHGGDIEVVVKTAEVVWIVSVVGSAAETLGLAKGSEVHLIMKARSCHVLGV